MLSEQVLEKLRQESQALEEQLITWRRHLHQYPELSFEEYKTQAYIAEELAKMGYEAKQVASTGLYLDIVGAGGEGPHRLLRADIDALPIEEEDRGKPYHSKHAGIMHACGHDVHTSCLLGAAALLKVFASELRGTVRLLFQPGEEKLPGGASLLIEAGMLEPRGEYIVGQHIEPGMPLGCIGLRSGAFMASADELYLRIVGKQGHAARPQDCIDPISISAQVLTALQQLVSRQSDPLEPLVLSFGKIYSEGGATNIIPPAVCIEGTLRSFNEELRQSCHEKLLRIAKGISQALGGDCELRIIKGYPSLHNAPEQTVRFAQRAKAYLGEDKVLELPLRMGAEDFAFYAQAMPACFYRLGVENPNKTGLHSSSLDVREEALGIGAALLTLAVL